MNVNSPDVPTTGLLSSLLYANVLPDYAVTWMDLLVAISISYCILRLVKLARDLRRGYSEYRGIIGPVEWPIVSHLPLAIRRYSNFYDHFYSSWKELGQPRFLYLKLPFYPRYYCTLDPDVLELALKSQFEAFEKGPVLQSILCDLLGHGIFASDGQQWLVQRKTASNIFFIRNFRDFFMRVFIEESEAMVKILDQCARHKVVLDLHDLFHRFTLQSFLRIGFNRNLRLLDHYHTELESFIQQRQQAPSSAKSSVFLPAQQPFAHAFETAQSITDRRLFNPFWQWSEWVTGDKVKMRECVKVMDRFVGDVIEEHRHRQRENEEVDENTNEGKDLLSRFMALRDDEGKPLDDAQLRDILMNMIIAGRDTTAQALSWCVLELYQHPQCIQKLRSTLKRALTDDNTDSHDVFPPHPAFLGATGSRHDNNKSVPLSYDHLQRWKYGHAVLSETLRLHPSVPKQSKQAVKSVLIPKHYANDEKNKNGEEALIEQGGWLVWLSWAMGRCERLWGSNAHQFIPQRFLMSGGAQGADESHVDGSSDNGENENEDNGSSSDGLDVENVDDDNIRLRNFSQFKFISFNAGPRLCLGKNMAYLEAQTVLAYLYSYFDFEVLTDPALIGNTCKGLNEWEYRNALTLPMKNGLPVMVSRRRE